MARQKISENWKIVEVLYDGKDFYEKVTKLGRYTLATAIEKMNSRFPEYKFREQPYSGSTGYWVNKDGDTANLCPDCFPQQKSTRAA